MGLRVGDKAFTVGDLDGDGTQEVFATASLSSSQGGLTENQYWYTLKADGAAYRHDWIGPTYPSSIDAAAVRNIDGDPALEVVILTGGQLLIYDGATRALESVRTLLVPATSMTIVDVDTDGALEIVLGGSNGLHIYGLASGLLEYENPDLLNYGLTVGNVDADPELEIVLSRVDGPGLILNGVTRAVEWSVSVGLGYRVRVGDLDQDGKQEVIADYGSVIRIFDVDLHSITDSISADLDTNAIEVFDVDGDGTLEIVYGEAQQGSVHVHDGATRSLRWSITVPDAGVASLAVGDGDNDGVRELFWSAGYRSTGPDHLYSANTQTQAIEWKGEDIVGPFAVSYGDVDADGSPEVVSASFQSESGYGEGVLFIHDALTGRIEHQQIVEGLTRLARTKVANVDSDVQPEIFIGADPQFTGTVICYDGLTHVEQWRKEPKPGLGFGSMEIADLDSDGTLEIVVGTGIAGYDGGGYIVVLDARTGTIEWESSNLPAGQALYNLSVANVDADPNLEIIVGTFMRFYVIDGATHATTTTSSPYLSSIATADLDGDGIAELLVADDEGVATRHPTTGAVLQRIAPWRQRDGSVVLGIQVVDLDGREGYEYVMLVGDELVMTRSGGCEIWRGKVRGQIADIDDDGRLDALLGWSGSGFDVHELAPIANLPCRTTIRPGVVAGDFEGMEAFAWSQTPSTPDAAPVVYVDLTGTGRGTAPPYLGQHFAWFGRAPGPSASRISQPLWFPVSDDLVLRFRMRNGAVSAPYTAVLQVSIDGVPVATYREGTSPDIDYLLREIDVTSFANGSNHTLQFAYSNPDSGVAYFTVDNVEIAGGGIAAGPALAIDDVQAPEGQSGVSMRTLSVSLSESSSVPVTVHYSTRIGTADVSDYVPTTGDLTFSPGETRRSIDIGVKGDLVSETDEYFSVELSAATNATIVDRRARVTIVNDESSGLFVDDAVVTEGTGVASSAVFTVRLGTPSIDTVTVEAITMDGSASAYDDYHPTGPVTVTFAPGETVVTVVVPVVADSRAEEDEQFRLTLRTPVNAPIVHGTGIGTIRNDDPSLPGPSRVFVSTAGNNSHDCASAATACRSIATAIGRVGEDGEVIILTTGEYETLPLAISKGVKVSAGSGTVAFIRQPIIVDAPGQRVVLRGLTLKGAGSGQGVTLIAASSLSVEATWIDGWATGLRLTPVFATRVSVSDSVFVANNVGASTGGTSDLGVSFESTRFDGNQVGLSATLGSFTLRESTFVGQLATGLAIGGEASVVVHRSDFSINGTAIQVDAGGSLRLGRSTLFGNVSGLSAAAGSVVESAGTNVIRGNGTDTTGVIVGTSER